MRVAGFSVSPSGRVYSAPLGDAVSSSVLCQAPLWTFVGFRCWVISIIAGALCLLLARYSGDLINLTQGLHLAVGGLTILLGGLGIATGCGLLLRDRWASRIIMCHRASFAGHHFQQRFGMGWGTHFIGIGIWWLMLFTGKAADEVHVRPGCSTCGGFGGVMAADSRRVVGANPHGSGGFDFLL